jgi:membrane protease YdiL (CAAX protease family)
MSITPFPPEPPEPPAPAPGAPAPGPRGQPLLAWLVIVGVIAFVLWRHAQTPSKATEKDEEVQIELQGRTLVATHSLSKQTDLSGQLEILNRGPYGQRLRCAILAGELEGPKQALEELAKLDKLTAEGHLTPAAQERHLARLLERQYKARESSTPTQGAVLLPAEKEELREQLGWFGRLALTSPGDDPDAPERREVIAPARRSLVGAITMMSVFGLGGLLGAVLLVTLVVLALMGYLRGGMSPTAGHGGIYAETFACYMALYIGLSYLARFLPGEWDGMLVSAALMLLSLTVLVWPLLRGLSWQQVCADIGWTRGRQPAARGRLLRGLPWLRHRLQGRGGRPLVEVLLGPACYLSALPGLLGGALFLVLMQTVRRSLGLGPDEFSPGENPTHPIVHEVANGTFWMRAQVLFVAAVCAPLVEETMFRGVLYRHLRDAFVPEAGSRRRRILGVLLAMLLVSFVFAVIHPQGLLAVPALMSLALGFNLFREWRGTLVPAMIAHGINNALVTAFLIFTMGDGVG